MCNPFVRSIMLAAVIAFPGASFHLYSAEAAVCRGGSKLGTHRTVTLNTNGGARFGSSHGGHRNFLKAKEVVLTFDDGPSPSTTNQVLHALEQHCAKATFFMVGSMVRANTSTAKKVAAKGHTIGIHSDTHKNLGSLGANSAIKDVDKSIVTINNKVGRNVAKFFRFPYLSENKSVNRHLSRKNYGVFAIDVDSLDYRISNPNSLVNRIMSQLRKQGSKGIILMHDTKKVTARATGILLNRLHAEGYKLVHIRGAAGGSRPDPALIAAVEDTDNGPLLVARAGTGPKKRSQAIKRVRTAQIDQKTIARSFTKLRGVSTRDDTDAGKTIQIASLNTKPKLRKKPKSAKKIQISKKRKVEPPKKQVLTLKARQAAFKERRAKAIARINTRNKKFRAAMQSRFITQ